MIIEFEKDNNETYRMNNNEIRKLFPYSRLDKGEFTPTLYKAKQTSFEKYVLGKMTEGYTSIRFIKGENYRWLSLRENDFDDVIHALSYIINL